MYKRHILLVCVILTCIVQLGVAGNIIYTSESTLRSGTTHIFKTLPVDPYDAFRGRYVRISMDIQQLQIEDEEIKTLLLKNPQCAIYDDCSPNIKIFAIFSKDEKGISKIKSLHLNRPETSDYLETKTLRYFKRNNMVTIEMPFERFYMEESKAEDADIVLRSGNRSMQKEALVSIKLNNGVGIIENVLIDSVPLREYVEKNAAGK